MQNKKSNRKQVRNSLNTLKNEPTEVKPVLGLGDAIQKITKATGIEKAVKFLAGEDCGCDERRQLLNELFPTKKPLCLTEAEYEWLTRFRAIKSDTINHEEAKTLSAIYSRIFQLRRPYMPCKCDPSAWNELIAELNKVYGSYSK